MAISNSKCEKLLGIHIDNKLTFEPHVRSLWKKGSQKLNALARIAYSLRFDQRKLLLNAFITSQFSYAPVIWIFFNLNNHTNCIQERSGDIVYQGNNLTFDEFLAKDGSFKIHDQICRNYILKYLKLKIHKIMNEVFDIIECS